MTSRIQLLRLQLPLVYDLSAIGMTRLQLVYLLVFTATLFACWSPYKYLPYLVPFVALGIVIWMVPYRSILRNLLLLIAIWIGWIGIGALLNPDFIFQNALLAVMTYNSFYIPLVIPARYLAGETLYRCMAKILLVITIIEASIGFIQAIYGYTQKGSFDLENGDFVEGTIDLALAQSPGFETPMFATNMAFSLLAMMPMILVYKKKSWTIPILFGAAVLVLASVVHVLIYLFAAIVVALIIFRPITLKHRRVGLSLLIFGLLIAFLIGLTSVLLPTNLNRVTLQFERAIQLGNPKVILLQRLFTVAPQEYPWLPTMGIGPGQFSSRASLIGSGYYYGGIENPITLPLLKPAVSKSLDLYVLDLWMRILNWPGTAGSTMKPWASWLSIFSEAGAAGVIAVIFVFTGTLWIARKSAKSWSKRVIGFSFGAGVILLFLLGMQENYWETTQAILIGCLSLKQLYANLINLEITTIK